MINVNDLVTITDKIKEHPRYKPHMCVMINSIHRVIDAQPYSDGVYCKLDPNYPEYYMTWLLEKYLEVIFTT